ncbi:MAG: Ig-like domain-containing protein [Bacteroidales bacterium]|nr:Ig-like domain-containing protein [Bacteroidales bacterium]
MKKKNYILVVAAAILAASCVEGIDSAVTHEKNVTITAYSAEAEGTRSTLIDGGTNVYWEPEDEIKLFTMGSSIRLQTAIQAPEQTATFYGTIPFIIGSNEGQSTSTTLWALYPYREDASFANNAITTILPDEQTAREGSFAKNTNITIAKANSFNMGFYNVCGGLRFRLTRDGINRVVFKASGGEALAGKFKATFDNGVPVVSEVLEGKDSIVLTMPSKGIFNKNQWYYLCALPGTLSRGFTLRFETETHYAEVSQNKSVTIKRGIFGQLDNFDEYLTFTKKGETEDESGIVDLGLRVKWATCNLGASKPEEFGHYYQWAGTSNVSDTSTYLNFSNCPYHVGDSNTSGWTKYIPSGMKSYWYPSGDSDNKTVLGLEDDAAQKELGGSWCMPTLEDFKELLNNCDAEWTTLNGVYGRRFTSRKNGNRIFLPAAGYRTGDSFKSDDLGFYWTSSVDTDAPDHAYNLTFSSTEVQALSNYRFTGGTVRPIFMVKVTGVGLNATSLSMLQREAYTLSAIITPYNASVPDVVWSSSNTDVATIDSSGKVTAVGKGNAVITVKTTDGGFTATCNVSVNTINVLEPEAVDMGLSVKWASFNLGATHPEDVGYYYQYAGTRDVSDTSIDLQWSNCPHHIGSNQETGWTKYCHLDRPSYWSGKGSPDNKTVLDPEDDAAYVVLGGRWRIPTIEEFVELIENCDAKWDTLNGVKGRWFTSKKEGYTDKKIFLPISGYRYESGFWSSSTTGLYRSSSLHPNTPCSTDILYFHDASVTTILKDRYLGQPVRPVLTK